VVIELNGKSLLKKGADEKGNLYWEELHKSSTFGEAVDGGDLEKRVSVFKKGKMPGKKPVWGLSEEKKEELFNSGN